MTDLVRIWQQQTGRSKLVTRRQYDRLWKGRNWRLSPPKTSSPEPSGDVETGDEPDNDQGEQA